MKYAFKTNINCIGCVTQIKPHLDGLEKSQTINHWHIDLNNPDHILTIETNNLTKEEVETVIENAGFKAQGIS